jgi:3-deoxy-D-manno-octulosonic-acid transferase
MLCGSRKSVRRSQDALPGADTEIYVADTIGELGLFYRLAPFAFIGGSLIPHGGQNPLEPARLGCAVIAGPHVENFRQPYDAILSAQGLGRVASAGDIAAIAQRLIADPAEAKKLGEAAQAAAIALGGAVEKTITAIEALLDARA